MLCLIILILYKFDCYARPIIYTFSDTQVRILTSILINDAINEQLKKNSSEFCELSKVNYLENGKISGVTVDTVKVNIIKESLLKNINEELLKLQDQKFSVPLGTVLNLTIFGTVGPNVNISITPLNFATAEIISTFESAGVNQTIHKISLVVTVKMRSLIPGYSNASTVKSETIISQTIIVGEVPQ
ncbi:MAG: sporulation protein YunB, partial [Oscillospiraceae bacterium]